MGVVFAWDHIQRRGDGRVLLLYRHERIFAEGAFEAGGALDVLDIGGWGVLAQRLLEDGHRCTILDLFTPDQAYPDRVRALPHKVGDARDARCFAAASFDVVTCFETLEHCGDAAAVLRNARTWLREGGCIIGTVPVDGYCHHAGEPGIELLGRDELAALLRASGFSRVHVEETRSIDRNDPSEPESCVYFRGRASAT